MRFGVLGTLEIQRDDGTQTVIQQPRLRSLLTVILVNHGQVLSTEQISSLLWDTDVPNRANHAIHAYMSMLRRQLEPSEVIINVRPGYRTDLTLNLLDVDEFHDLRDLGASAFSAENFPQACTLLDQASALWRNPELPDTSLSASLNARNAAASSMSAVTWSEWSGRWRWPSEAVRAHPTCRSGSRSCDAGSGGQRQPLSLPTGTQLLPSGRVHATAVWLPGVVNDQRPDRDSNAGLPLRRRTVVTGLPRAP
jgi:DNA-binding winged helix-turn-helix (wHTH) protein